MEISEEAKEVMRIAGVAAIAFAPTLREHCARVIMSKGYYSAEQSYAMADEILRELSEQEGS